MNGDHVPRPIHACTHPYGACGTRATNLYIWRRTHDETLVKAVRNATRRIEYKHHLTAIGVQG